MKCKNCDLVEDIDVVAVLNLQMRGLGVTSKGRKSEKGDEHQSGYPLTNTDIR